MIDTKTTAHTNIALIKYWGKKDEKLRIPYTDSLSLTLDKFYTETTTSFTDSSEDIITLDGKKANNSFATRVKHYLDFVRSLNGSNQTISVNTINHVPTSAGLASSASGFAALAGSLNKLFKMNINSKDLSRLARMGSGSACRSIFGGFVLWHHGDTDKNSYAEPIDQDNTIPIRIISVVTNSHKKKISSTIGMRRAVETSPFYPVWPQIVNKDLRDILDAIKNQDLEQIGKISENNCMSMHALDLSARPSFNYFSAKTLEVIDFVQQLRKKGYLAYVTIDAGPNVKVIVSQNDVKQIDSLILNEIDNVQTTILKPGTGIA